MQAKSGAYATPVGFKDVTLIHAWRNSKASREASSMPRNFGLLSHWIWFLRLKPAERPLMVIEGEEKIGVVQFTRLGELYRWSFYKNPQANAVGLSIMVAGLDYAEVHLGISQLSAWVKATNIASIALHERLGFFRSGQAEDGSTIMYEKNLMG